MAGVDPSLGREGHQPLHDRVNLIGIAARAAAGGTADGPLEEAIGSEAVGLVDEERQVTAAMARRGDRPNRECARGDDVAVVDRLVDRHSCCRRFPAADDRHTEAARQPGDIDDVIGMLVRDEDMGDRQAARRHLLEQWAFDAIRIDQHAVPSVLVRDEVGVRRPGRMLRALDDHERNPTAAPPRLLK